jgi:hypothetical protein
MFDPFQDWNPHFIENNSLTKFCYLPHQEKNSIKVLKEGLGVKYDVEGAEYDDIEEANIGKMNKLFETE